VTFRSKGAEVEIDLRGIDPKTRIDPQEGKSGPAPAELVQRLKETLVVGRAGKAESQKKDPPSSMWLPSLWFSGLLCQCQDLEVSGGGS